MNVYCGECKQIYDTDVGCVPCAVKSLEKRLTSTENIVTNLNITDRLTAVETAIEGLKNEVGKGQWSEPDQPSEPEKRCANCSHDTEGVVYYFCSECWGNHQGLNEKPEPCIALKCSNVAEAGSEHCSGCNFIIIKERDSKQPPMPLPAKALKACGYEVKLCWRFKTLGGCEKESYWVIVTDNGGESIPTEPTFEWAMQRLEEYLKLQKLRYYLAIFNGRNVIRFHEVPENTGPYWDTPYDGPLSVNTILEAIVKHSEVAK